MTDRLRAIEGLALVAALTAVFDGAHGLGDHWVNAAETVSTMSSVSVLRLATGVGGLPSQAPVSRSCGVAISPHHSLLWVAADDLHRSEGCRAEGGRDEWHASH